VNGSEITVVMMGILIQRIMVHFGYLVSDLRIL